MPLLKLFNTVQTLPEVFKIPSTRIVGILNTSAKFSFIQDENVHL